MTKFQTWLNLQQQLKIIKSEEMRLRKELAMDVLSGQVPPCRVKHVIEGTPVKVVQNVSHKLDPVVFNQIFENLTDFEKSAVKFTPELRLREYKKVSGEALLHEAVTVKPSAPTITVIQEV